MNGKALKKYLYYSRRLSLELLIYLKLRLKGKYINSMLKLPVIRTQAQRFIIRKWHEVYPLRLENLYIPILPQLLRPGSVVLEIGSGHGETALELAKPRQMAQKQLGLSPTPLVITAEYRKRYYDLTRKRAKLYQNIIPVYGDGYKLAKFFASGSIDLILVLFPDPWHKKKHNKRRPLTTNTFKIFHKVLKKSGRILIATDHPDYFDFITEQIQATRLFALKIGDFDPKHWGLPPTHYYKKWVRFKKRPRFIVALPW